MKLIGSTLILTVASLLVACSHTTVTPPAATSQEAHGLSPADVSEAIVWGAADNVRKIKHIYISAQPDDLALQSAKAAGVTTVVSLRETHEYEWDEQAAVEGLGMSYVNVPIPKQSESFDTAALQEIERIVSQTHDSAVLLHCSSGNRAAAWLASHLAGAHGMSTKDAMAIATKAGLTHNATQQRVLHYIDNH